jgi:hypothetical protein
MRKSRMSLKPARSAKFGTVMRAAPDFNAAYATTMGTCQKLCHSTLAAHHVAGLSGLYDIMSWMGAATAGGKVTGGNRSRRQQDTRRAVAGGAFRK